MFEQNFKLIINKINKLLLNIDQSLLVKLTDEMIKRIENKKKIIILGNGGSQAIASHISTDIARTCNSPSISCESSSLITCFSNDYSYKNSLSKFIEIYSLEGDLIILISSSGESENIIRAAKKAISQKLTLVTLTGFKKDNTLSQLGNINIHIPIEHYNIVENTHQIILTTCLDIINNKIIE